MSGNSDFKAPIIVVFNLSDTKSKSKILFELIFAFLVLWSWKKTGVRWSGLK